MTRGHLFAWAGIGLVAIAAVALSVILVPDLRGVLGAALAVVMLAIVVIDAQRFIIPDPLSAAALLLGVVHAIVASPEPAGWALSFAALRAGVLVLIFLAVRAGYQWLRGREGLGLGDVKIAGVAGVWLDWLMLPTAVEIAALAAIAVYVSRQYLLKRPLNLSSRLPFGAFLAPSIWLCWLLEQALVSP